MDWLIVWLIDWFIDWLINWLINWLIDWLVDLLNEKHAEVVSSENDKNKRLIWKLLPQSIWT